ncbi:MAG: LysR substrate-binding domain-containing protein [Anaeromyxobacteraceae bacterium]
MPAPASLDDLALLVEVVARGGFAAAGAALGVRKSTVSRRLAALEARLGVRLLERSGRGHRLTEDGRRYHQEAARIVAEARRLDERTGEARGVPQGTLRVATLALLGELLAPVLAALLLRHPRLAVEVAFAEQHVDLLGGAHDLAIRTGPLPDSSLVARRLGTLRAGCYASPAYLARAGTPRAPGELTAHEAVLLAPAGSDEVWFFGEGREARTVPVAGRLRVASLRAVQAAARAGLGIARLPASLVADDVRAGLLVQVLAAETPPGLPVLAVLASRQPPARVRALLELLAERGAAVPWEPVAGRSPVRSS